MTPQDQARLLLDRARRVMSGKEIEICEAVASGENPNDMVYICDDRESSATVHYVDKPFQRITTEFAAYLNP